MDFMGFPFTNAYNGLTNIVLTVTPTDPEARGRKGLLIAAHHDTAVASPGRQVVLAAGRPLGARCMTGGRDVLWRMGSSSLRGRGSGPSEGQESQHRLPNMPYNAPGHHLGTADDVPMAAALLHAVEHTQTANARLSLLHLPPPGAADDVSMVAVMLEAARAMLARRTPPPVPLVFLFDGGEESICQVSRPSAAVPSCVTRPCPVFTSVLDRRTKSLPALAFTSLKRINHCLFVTQAAHGFAQQSPHYANLGAFINLEVGAQAGPSTQQHTRHNVTVSGLSSRRSTALAAPVRDPPAPQRRPCP